MMPKKFEMEKDKDAVDDLDSQQRRDITKNSYIFSSREQGVGDKENIKQMIGLHSANLSDAIILTPQEQFTDDLIDFNQMVNGQSQQSSHAGILDECSVSS